MNPELENKLCDRFKILRALYDLPFDENANIMDVASGKGIKNGRFKDAFDYLSNEDLVSHTSNMIGSITHKGRKAIEQTLRFPEKETEYFPPLNQM